MSEVDAIRERYERRSNQRAGDKYSALLPENWLTAQERQRKLIELFSTRLDTPLEDVTVLEIGCGVGSNLLELIRLGFDPQRLVGNELLPERAAQARRNLPIACQILAGDAASLEIPGGSFDIVYQSTVFTSILDGEFQSKVAHAAWHWLKPGGSVLWYDFVYDNPANPDVRGVPIRRIRQLFPEGEIASYRITLAPPISRRVSRIHPMLYHLFNAVPWLRTHVLCWISKPKPEPGTR